MEINNSKLEISAVYPNQYPHNNLPEIAFTGRSNVGKSSLINSLVNRKNLAYTSNKPGKTRTLNFYNIENEFYFVDIPGYGYAKVSHKSRNNWASMIEKYFINGEKIHGVISLVDARHSPTLLDCQMVDFLHYYHLPLLVIGTKIDKIATSKWIKNKLLIEKVLNLSNDDTLQLFSAQTNYGKEKILEWIYKHLN